MKQSDRYRSLYKLSKHPLIHPLVGAARKMAWKPTLFLLSLFMGKVTYFRMGTVSNKNCDFQIEPRFAEAYKAAETQQYMLGVDIWRYHINLWAVQQALKLEGDLVECGVYKGSTAMCNIVYFGLDKLPRKYYLFDTFDGLDEKIASPDEMSRLKDEYPDCYKFVVESFRPYPNVVIVKGSVPGTLAEQPIEKVAYLSIDMNCAAAERAAMEYFWPKLVTGGVIVLDDYGWPMCEEQKRMADEFAQSVGTMVMALPNGQGLIVK